MRKLFMILCLSGWGMAAWAQNSIDRLVEEYSTVGNSKFTSVVERNPQTKKVVQVVKSLKSDNGDASELRKAFEQESQSIRTVQVQTKEMNVQVLCAESEKETRVYMLKHNPRYKKGYEVTIIIKYK
ncbi:MAG: DUF5024 domain-containing protein [Paraprevotella sp.]|nr:DUF5024 domain-containing protein [Paraprevotella sp.]